MKKDAEEETEIVAVMIFCNVEKLPGVESDNLIVNDLLLQLV